MNLEFVGLVYVAFFAYRGAESSRIQMKLHSAAEGELGASWLKISAPDDVGGDPKVGGKLRDCGEVEGFLEKLHGFRKVIFLGEVKG